MIDLDQSVPPPATAARPRWRLIALCAGLLVLGVLIGATVVSFQQRGDRRAQVTLLVLAQPSTVTEAERVVVDGAVLLLQIKGRAALVNAGPEAVQFRAFRAGIGSALVAEIDTAPQRIEPGTIAVLDLDVKMTCTAAGVGLILQAHVTVETADRKTRTVVLPFDAAPWVPQIGEALHNCQ